MIKSKKIIDPPSMENYGDVTAHRTFTITIRQLMRLHRLVEQRGKTLSHYVQEALEIALPMIEQGEQNNE